MNINKTHLSWAEGAIIIIIDLALRLPRLGHYDNLYYTAGVQSMTQNWSNFIYGSFDPVGLITLDKPPLAFWVQTIPSILFGVDAWAVTIGGFSGNDSILSLDEFKEMSDVPRRPIRNINKPQNQVIADYVRGHWVDYSQKLGLPENTLF